MTQSASHNNSLTPLEMSSMLADSEKGLLRRTSQRRLSLVKGHPDADKPLSVTGPEAGACCNAAPKNSNMHEIPVEERLHQWTKTVLTEQSSPESIRIAHDQLEQIGIMYKEKYESGLRDGVQFLEDVLRWRSSEQISPEYVEGEDQKVKKLRDQYDAPNAPLHPATREIIYDVLNRLQHPAEHIESRTSVSR